jgi:hypothetical protein
MAIQASLSCILQIAWPGAEYMLNRAIVDLPASARLTPLSLCQVEPAFYDGIRIQ